MRFRDRFRTVINVGGDCIGVGIVYHFSKKHLDNCPHSPALPKSPSLPPSTTVPPLSHVDTDEYAPVNATLTTETPGGQTLNSPRGEPNNLNSTLPVPPRSSSTHSLDSVEKTSEENADNVAPERTGSEDTCL